MGMEFGKSTIVPLMSSPLLLWILNIPEVDVRMSDFMRRLAVFAKGAVVKTKVVTREHGHLV